MKRSVNLTGRRSTVAKRAASPNELSEQDKRAFLEKAKEASRSSDLEEEWYGPRGEPLSKRDD